MIRSVCVLGTGLFVVAAALVATAQPTASSLPAIGIAVEEMDGRWCVEFPPEERSRVSTGSPVTVVFPDGAEALVWNTRISTLLRRQCQTAFPQPRWYGYVAYSLDAFSESASSAVGARKTVGLAVVSSAGWRRTATGVLRADLDGDGLPEEARRCAADEGEHFTLWNTRSDGGSVRRAHEYFDWGGITEPTCRPGEDGR